MVPFPVNVTSGISTDIFRHNLRLIPKKCSDYLHLNTFFFFEDSILQSLHFNIEL